MAKLKAQQRSLSDSTDPKLKVNLKDIFGVTIDNMITREQVNQSILDKILIRTDKGVDIDGKKFKKYSKSYIDSDAFKAFGKSPGKVNLRLTSDMLELMDVVDESKNTTTYGWDDGEEGGKAHGHITGGGNLPRRDFFALTDKDIAELRREFKSQIEAEPETGLTDAAILDAIRRITGG